MPNYIRVFPASSTDDWGRILTEKNIRSILGFIASSRAVVSGFVMNGTQIADATQAMSASIGSGKAIFDGYQLDFTPFEQYNIAFPSGIVTGEYYVCLRVKFSTGTTEFIEYKDFKDLPEGFDVNCPFVVIPSATELIPDAEITADAGYIYKYLPLYKLIYINSVLGAQCPIDLRNRSFINCDKISLGYKGDTVGDYFGFDTTDTTEGLRDWKIKANLSRQGEVKSAEELLYQYINFIHTVVRGYSSLDDLTTENIGTSLMWDTEEADAEGGESPLPIISKTDPANGIVRRLKYTVNNVRSFINDKIVTPTIGEGGAISYNLANFSLGHILTMDNEKLLNRIFLPKASTTGTGIVQISEAFAADTDASYQDTKVVSIDQNGLLKARGPRYAIAHIKYKALSSTPTASTINIVSNDSNVEFDADQNIQLSAVTTDKYNPIIKIAVYGTVGLAYGLQYDAAVDVTTLPGNTGKTYFVMNQNLRKTDNVEFNKVTVTDQIIASTINPTAGLTINGETTINGNTTVDGEITADLVHNAGHNDVAELFKKGTNSQFEPGDIIAKIPGTNTYALATQETAHLVVGVYSDTYGQLLGGDKEKTSAENLENHLPIGISGRVWVKVTGPVWEGDLITVSPINGVGIKVRRRGEYIPGTIIGKALETKDDLDIRRIEMMIALM